MSTTADSYNCSFYTDTPLTKGTDVPADSDLVGPPMLIAFFVTATISITAVLFAYLSGALEESSQTFVDAKLLAKLHNFLYSLHPGHQERRGSMVSQMSIKTTRNFRKEGLTQFILALSDQQLVTGTAILIAALVNLGGYNRFELIMIDSLAWFSATTHLATLDILSHYLASRRIVRAARIVLIVGFLVLFTCTFIIRAIDAMAGVKLSSLAICGWIQREPHISKDSNWNGSFNIAWQTSWTVALLLVLLGYLVRTQALLCNQRHPFYVIGWLSWSFKNLGARYTSYSKIYTENKAALRYQRILWVSGSNGQKRWMPFGYDDSFLSSIPGILFSFSYGVSQLASVRWGMDLNFVTQDRPWGFGQIVALLLLCLPFMAAGATISEYKQKQRNEFTFWLRELESGERSTTISSFDLPATAAPNRSIQESAIRRRLQDQDIEVIEAEYAEKLPRIKQYFCKYVNIIAQDEAQIKNRLQIARAKQALLKGFEVVEQRERDISIVPHAVWFVIQSFGALALGALLNAASFDAAAKTGQSGVWFSIAVLLVFVSIKVITLTYEMIRILRFEA